VPFENCAITDPYTFVLELPFRLGLGHLLTGIRGHHASLLLSTSEEELNRNEM